jgi:hypothetical protein
MSGDEDRYVARLACLEEMLRKLICDHAAIADDVSQAERAGYLKDAIDDLRIIIRRVQDERPALT